MIPIKAQGHPCFDETAHHKVGRMHIPVAPACNIQCRYCYREIGSTDNRPGVAYKILKPGEALAAVEAVVATDKSIRVIGVAGPGDALANEATFNSLALIHKKFPRLKKCISTNGLRLAERVDELVRVGVSTISVTVNAVKPSTGREFYRKVKLNGRNYFENAFDILSARQLMGIEAAVSEGLVVKVNTVLVPELNGDHIEDVARVLKTLGVSLMNIMPLKPLGDMSGYRAPTCLEIEEARYYAGRHIEQFRACKQCRADAVGIPGHDAHTHALDTPHGDTSKTLGEIFAGVPLYH
jgi:nitrogen fixation protein NifB